MRTAFVKKMILGLVLGLLSSSFVHAEIRNYQYDGKLPFVQMMLNMMVAMGIIDRVPVNGIYNRRNMYTPYGMRNYLYGNRNWNNNVWGNDSWSNGSWNNAATDSVWGQPRWGVLSEDPYSQNYPPSVSDGWVNEPWELSVWNKKKQNQALESPEDNRSMSQPLPILKNKACVTDLCGLQVPDLNGLWVGREGEMLGIKNGSFLWSDGLSRHLTGNLKPQNDYFIVRADGYDRLMQFKYKLDGNYLLTMQPDGLVREFRRVSDGYSY